MDHVKGSSTAAIGVSESGREREKGDSMPKSFVLMKSINPYIREAKYIPNRMNEHLSHLNQIF